MKVNVTQVLMDIEGKPLLSKEADFQANPPTPKVEATLRKVCVDALMGAYQGENIDGTEKYKRYNLAKILSKFDEPELRLDQINAIIGVVEKAYGPIVYGPVRDILDPPTAETVS